MKKAYQTGCIKWTTLSNFILSMFELLRYQNLNLFALNYTETQLHFNIIFVFVVNYKFTIYGRKFGCSI